MEEKCCSTLPHFSFPCHPPKPVESQGVPQTPSSSKITSLSSQKTTRATSTVRLNKDAKEFVSNLAKIKDIGSLTPGFLNNGAATAASDATHVTVISNVTDVPGPVAEFHPPNSTSIQNTLTSNVETVSNSSGITSPPININLSSNPNFPSGSLLSESFPSLSGLESNYHKSTTSSGYHGNSSPAAIDRMSSDTNEPEENRLTRQNSLIESTDHLECMLSNELTGTRLPLYSSWSLCRLGNASSYQVSKGLEQPGFFPGSNFLLPWDIPLLNENQMGLSSFIDGNVKHPGVKTAGVDAWPAPNELLNANSSTGLPLYQTLAYASRQCTDYKVNPLPICLSSQITTKSNVAKAQRRQYPTVRAYIGNEYECARGHRYV